ncbi:uncharacterized protein LOC110692182 [Chenopodium quinoa]|uniref:uncharacterized protein LOC110692182 n=1 Tax=Chenopodium quinoa TaxID=63459 RepID=UPI000B76DEB7|nr:uncharacterized protein LOC110692182 [Chenopodium quinoa]
MRKVGQKEGFKFHHRCSSMRLNHLVFADDLMMFACGNRRSLSLCSRALKTFYLVSGLQANEEKTVIMFGIPLNSKYLRARDFDVLIDKMMARVHCWASRNLSFAGRVVLINAVLISFYSFWAQYVLLPKRVIDRINQPRKAGGLGTRDCFLWNKAALGKHVWSIACKKDSLWVKWVHNVYIKNKSWWDYKPSKGSGWGWKRIYKIKDEMKPGFLSKQWTETGYSIKEGYNWLQGNSQEVAWTGWMWNAFNVPKHSFIAWIAIHDRLRLKSRLYKSGICDNDKCLLCDVHPETIQHLFFECNYSKICLKNICSWLGMQSRNNSYWQKAVIHPEKICKAIKLETMERSQQMITRQWTTEQAKWLCHLRRSA